MGGIPVWVLWGVLLLTIVGEFTACSILKKSVSEYNPRFQVMSALGAGDSPVQFWYRVWLVWLGPVFVIWAFLVHDEVIRASSNPFLSTASAACLVVFGMGAGIVAGIFPGSGSGRLSTMLHGVASALGFISLVVVPLLLGLAFKSREPAFSFLSLVCFTVSTVFFVLFVMSDKAAFLGTWVSWGGWHERACLACAYLPVAVLSVARVLGA